MAHRPVDLLPPQSSSGWRTSANPATRPNLWHSQPKSEQVQGETMLPTAHYYQHAVHSQFLSGSMHQGAVQAQQPPSGLVQPNQLRVSQKLQDTSAARESSSAPIAIAIANAQQYSTSQLPAQPPSYTSHRVLASAARAVGFSQPTAAHRTPVDPLGGFPHHHQRGLQPQRAGPAHMIGPGMPGRGAAYTSHFLPPTLPMHKFTGGSAAVHTYALTKSAAGESSATHHAPLSSGQTMDQHQEMGDRVSNPRLQHMALVRNEEQRQRDQLPQQFRSARVVTYQPKEHRWVSTFTSVQTKRQVRVYGKSALITAIRRDWARLQDGIKPRTGSNTETCSWLILALPHMFNQLCSVHGSGIVKGNGTLKYKDFVWSGPTPEQLESAADSLAPGGVVIDMNTWPTVYEAACKLAQAAGDRCGASDEANVQHARSSRPKKSARTDSIDSSETPASQSSTSVPIEGASLLSAAPSNLAQTPHALSGTVPASQPFKLPSTTASTANAVPYTAQLPSKASWERPDYKLGDRLYCAEPSRVYAQAMPAMLPSAATDLRAPAPADWPRTGYYAHHPMVSHPQLRYHFPVRAYLGSRADEPISIYGTHGPIGVPSRAAAGFVAPHDAIFAEARMYEPMAVGIQQPVHVHDARFHKAHPPHRHLQHRGAPPPPEQFPHHMGMYSRTSPHQGDSRHTSPRHLPEWGAAPSIAAADAHARHQEPGPVSMPLQLAPALQRP